MFVHFFLAFQLGRSSVSPPSFFGRRRLIFSLIELICRNDCVVSREKYTAAGSAKQTARYWTGPTYTVLLDYRDSVGIQGWDERKPSQLENVIKTDYFTVLKLYFRPLRLTKACHNKQLSHNNHERLPYLIPSETPKAVRSRAWYDIGGLISKFLVG